MRKIMNKICECGKTFNYGSKYDITRHENSKVHKEFLITNKTKKQIEEEEKQNKLKEKEEAKIRAKEKKSQYYKDRYNEKMKPYRTKMEIIALIKKIKSTLL